MPRPARTLAEQREGHALGLVVQQAREGRTSEQLARDAGVHLDVVRRIESGRVASPGFFLVVRLADALGVGLDDLRSRVGDKYEELQW
jgi:transcriptional regulator with XRE-family HTH domain